MSSHYSDGCLSFSYDQEVDVCYRLLNFFGLLGYRVGCNGTVWTRWLRKSLGYARGSKFVLTNQWRLLRPKSNGGYLCIWPHVKSGQYKGKGILLHHLVLEAFIGPWLAGTEGCHRDGKNQNNSLQNLRWDTASGNMDDTIRHGRHKSFKGEAHHKAKLTDAQVKLMRQMFATGDWSTAALGRHFGMSQQTTWGIVKGNGWKHIK